MTGRQGGVSTLAGGGREHSPLEVVGRDTSGRVDSEEWKKRLRRLDTAELPGL